MDMQCQMITHTVREGDNFYQLARYYHTTVGEIMAQNPGIDPYNLQVGTRLNICRGASFPLRYNTTRSRVPVNRPADMNRRMMLNNDMRRVWMQHVYWVRMLLISIAAGLADETAVTARTLQNAQDMERIFARYYPPEMAAEFAALIKDHLVIGQELITALKDKNDELATRLNNQWHDNADRIAELLGRMNPNFNTEQLRNMMYRHLALTGQETNARLAGQFAEDIQAFDMVENQAMEMADYLIQGIMRQFPQEF